MVPSPATTNWLAEHSAVAFFPALVYFFILFLNLCYNRRVAVRRCARNRGVPIAEVEAPGTRMHLNIAASATLGAAPLRERRSVSPCSDQFDKCSSKEAPWLTSLPTAHSPLTTGSNSEQRGVPCQPWENCSFRSSTFFVSTRLLLGAAHPTGSPALPP
jgi:hypothetical protein